MYRYVSIRLNGQTSRRLLLIFQKWALTNLKIGLDPLFPKDLLDSYNGEKSSQRWEAPQV